MYLELKAVVFEVSFNFFAVHVVHVQVRDSQDSAPATVAFSQLRVLRIENAIEKGEVVRYLLIAIDMESILGLQDRCAEVRHVEMVKLLYLKVEELFLLWLTFKDWKMGMELSIWGLGQQVLT